ncbi:piggyBac transposable element-derived protein 4-like [Apostichopus japonicus]|uniref:piggyBac transposable element-derived protein 4-like n=1 Tax=Stichopus japonicus TaxID=307972 RepID=UPI003AB5640D
MFIPHNRISLLMKHYLDIYFERLSFKTYNPRKPAKYGMKAYKICDGTGYTWKFKLYTGKEVDEEIEQLGGGIIGLVMHMMKELLRKEYHLFMDNWYSSPTLYQKLSENKTHAAGTVRVNRKRMPKELTQKKAKKGRKRGEVDFRRSENLLAMRFLDNRDVYMLSTIHDISEVETGKADRDTNERVKKPKLVVDYNQHMGSVDMADQMAKVYTEARRSIKWYKKLVWYLNDVAVTNAYIVYKLVSGRNISHMDYILALVDELITEGLMECGDDRPTPKKTGRRSQSNPARMTYCHSNHWPVYIESQPGTSKKNATRSCTVCSAKKTKPGEKRMRSETRYECKECKVALHVVVCFEKYHTLKNYADLSQDSSSDEEL